MLAVSRVEKRQVDVAERAVGGAAAVRADGHRSLVRLLDRSGAGWRTRPALEEREAFLTYLALSSRNSHNAVSAVTLRVASLLLSDTPAALFS